MTRRPGTLQGPPPPVIDGQVDALALLAEIAADTAEPLPSATEHRADATEHQPSTDADQPSTDRAPEGER